MRTDFLMVADAAQVAEGKLYLLGGAWNRITLGSYPGTLPIAVAIGIMVGWDETNERHTATFTLEDEDGHVVVGPVSMAFEVGRPAGIRAGDEQRVVMAVNAQLTLPGPAGYAVVVRCGEEEIARTSFRAVAS